MEEVIKLKETIIRLGLELDKAEKEHAAKLSRIQKLSKEASVANEKFGFPEFVNIEHPPNTSNTWRFSSPNNKYYAKQKCEKENDIALRKITLESEIAWQDIRVGLSPDQLRSYIANAHTELHEAECKIAWQSHFRGDSIAKYVGDSIESSPL